MTPAEAIAYLKAADIFIDNDESPLCIGLSDTFEWACADGEDLPESEAVEVAALHQRYGWCGVLYWVWERRKYTGHCEFQDINRFIDFVRYEERLRKEEPDSMTPADAKRTDNDRISDTVDDLLNADKFAEVDELLKAVDVSAIADAAIVSYLGITAAAGEHGLLKERAAFWDRAFVVVAKRRGNEGAEKLLRKYA